VIAYFVLIVPLRLQIVTFEYSIQLHVQQEEQQLFPLSMSNQQMDQHFKFIQRMIHQTQLTMWLDQQPHPLHVSVWAKVLLLEVRNREFMLL
jgi:hypothetical protein